MMDVRNILTALSLSSSLILCGRTSRRCWPNVNFKLWARRGRATGNCVPLLFREPPLTELWRIGPTKGCVGSAARRKRR
jgi:hypothetical protein